MEQIPEFKAGNRESDVKFIGSCLFDSASETFVAIEIEDAPKVVDGDIGTFLGFLGIFFLTG